MSNTMGSDEVGREGARLADPGSPHGRERAVHLCLMMRGVAKQNSKTIISALRGQFRTCPVTRDAFLRLAHRA
jgi:GTP cyclohydrolase I